MQRKGCTKSTAAKAMSRLNETSDMRSMATPVSDPEGRGTEPGSQDRHGPIIGEGMGPYV
jgi:hypothetical protein